MSLVADYSDSDENSEGGVTSDGSDPSNQSVKLPGAVNDDGRLRTGNISEGTKGQQKVPDGLSSNFLMIPGAGQDSSNSDSEDEASRGRTRKQTQIKLDNPFRTFGDVNVAKEDSVFRNPFRDKEEERIAVLEHHVKMTENPEMALTINGKKICWNYRKRKCYLGTQCPYAHDSDVPLTEEQLKEQKIENDLHRAGLINNSSIGVGIQPAAGKTHLPGTASAVAGGYDSSAFFSSPHLGGNNKETSNNNADMDDDEPSAPSNSRKRVRVGLRNGLVPPKKALHLYNTTKDKKC